MALLPFMELCEVFTVCFLLSGGVQGIIVCEATFEPGVEAYLAMGTQWYKNHAKSLVSVQLL